jgi:hypothetical protein
LENHRTGFPQLPQGFINMMAKQQKRKRSPVHETEEGPVLPTLFGPTGTLSLPI